jgi:hypothetical protein
MLEPSARLALEEEDRTIPDVVLPAQAPRRHAETPERALLTTLVLDAVEAFQRHHGATTDPERRRFEEAERWIFAGESGAPLEFADVCDLLSLDTELLRRGLRRWQARASQPRIATRRAA